MNGAKDVYASVPKPPVSSLITPYGSEKIDFPERGPVGVTKVELAVGALPEHKARQTHLSASPDDQIRILAVIGIQEFIHRLRGKFSEDFLGRIPSHKTILKITPYRVDDLLPAPVADANVQEHSIVVLCC